ncbi:MAG: lysozyme [Alphaproteobacteria bacterium]
MMRISKNGLKLIKHFEGYFPKAYRCPAGLRTIGYGHLIKKGEKFPDRLTHNQAEQLLLNDVKDAESAVHRMITVPLKQCQYDALVSFTFNLGAGALQRSTLRRKINRHEHEDVPKELMKWVRAGGRILGGLVKRRRAEVALYSGA